MLLVAFVFGLWISIYDLKYHRIPNRLLTAYLISSLIVGQFWKGLEVNSLILATSFFVVSLALSSLADMGAGDVKLLALCALVLIPPTRDGISTFISVFCIAISLHLAVDFQRKKALAGYVPLAPSIFVSAIWCASGA